MIERIKRILERHHTIKFEDFKIAVLDIGARGGPQWPWNMVDDDCLQITLVEPDLREADRLRKQFVDVLPYAFASKKGIKNLFINASPGTSSCFKPNLNFLLRYPEYQRFDCVQQVPVDCHSFDSIRKVEGFRHFDFAKIDVQGLELEILEGGAKTFSQELVGLEVEVEFVPIYEKQPLFDAVHQFVAERLGLDLWDIRGNYWKFQAGITAKNKKGRLVHGDFLYLRAPDSLLRWVGQIEGSQKQDHKLKAACTAAVVYGYYDYVMELRELVAKDPNFERREIRVWLDMLVSQLTMGRIHNFYSRGNSILYYIFNGLANFFKPSPNKWSIGDPSLGTKKQWPFW